MSVAASGTGSTAGGDEQPKEKSSAGAAAPPPSPEKGGIAAGRPAETVTALAGAAGAAITQLLDVDNAAIVSLLIALVGLLPALVTWLVEVGKKWDGSVPYASDDGVASELEYAQARLLRATRMVDADATDELTRVTAVRTAFADAKPSDGAK